MEENKDKEQELEQKPVPPIPDDVEEVASAEEIEAFMRERRKGRMEKKTQVERENPEVEEYHSEENALDPYLDPDPEIPWVKYEEPVYLSRGCNHCPKSYQPVCAIERQSCSKVTSTNWLAGIRQPTMRPFDCVEVRFKNNHKDFYRLPDGLEVTEGDIVAVEGQPGHDVGIVCLTGELCRLQMRKHKVNPESETIKKLFRRAKDTDIERWGASIREERSALIRTRQIAANLGLDMKVNDVEFQGDHSKAIFYYTADERVDFRELIKVLAEEFHVRIEMKQIGVRQEAGKVGGLGTCGRELCCATWLTNFKSVTTGAAKTQQIMPNPQKLAGQCGKLKCCLNFEYEVYADALKDFPQPHAIRFQKGLALYKKTDVFRGIMWYAYEGENELIAVKAEDVKTIMEMNRNQQYPEKLEDYQVELMSTSALASESNSEEVEREIQRLSEGGNGVVGQEEPRDDRRRDNGKRHQDGAEQRSPKADRGTGDRGERRDRDNRAREERHATRQLRQQQQNKAEGNQRREERDRKGPRPQLGDNRDRRSGGNRDRRG
jgi:cell fate regulator YaaT (PSP1 superfamily)